jgi:hypothetical protein
MLVTQLRRIMHTNPGVLVTCCDGQFFPAVTQFDRILCDVPCSGDGTSRKNISVWKAWSQMNALALHSLQVEIAWKGVAQLLKVGGYICYSTCSFNPLENEAVVAELLRRANGSLELVAYELKGFKTRPGWPKWHVFCEDKTRRETKNSQNRNNEKMQAKRSEFEGTVNDLEKTGEKDAVLLETNGVARGDGVGDERSAPAPSNRERFVPESMDENALVDMVKAAGFHHFKSFDEVPKHLERRIRSSCFPPVGEEATTFNLQRCIRCLPQDNDTGGFFVALLRKTSVISNADRHVAEAEGANSDKVQEPISKRSKMDEVDQNTNDEYVDSTLQEPADDAAAVDADNAPVRSNPGRSEQIKGLDDFAPVSDEILDSLVQEFGLTIDKDLFMTRACGKSKVIYFIPRPIKDLIDQGIQDRVVVINAGLKAFSRSTMDGMTIYRVCQEAAHFLAPHMTKRKFVVGLDDFRKCLTEERFVQIDALSDSLQTKVRELSVGSFVVDLDRYEDQLNQKLVATLWRCRSDRLDSLVAKVEIKAIATKLDAFQGAKQEIDK